MIISMVSKRRCSHSTVFQRCYDEQPIDNVIGGDVPDELCYQWAEEYFMDLNAKEDKTEEDEILFQSHTTVRSPHDQKRRPKRKRSRRKKLNLRRKKQITRCN